MTGALRREEGGKKRRKERETRPSQPEPGYQTRGGVAPGYGYQTRGGVAA